MDNDFTLTEDAALKFAEAGIDDLAAFDFEEDGRSYGADFAPSFN